MPACGRIGDSGILRELMQTLGPSASKDESCRTLQQWYNQARRERNNSAKNQKNTESLQLPQTSLNLHDFKLYHQQNPIEKRLRFVLTG